METNQTLFLECDCHSDEHTLKFSLDPDTGDFEKYKSPEIYTSVFLNDYRKWYQRLWIAVKYVFGYKCKYGHWDCFTFKYQEISKLQELLKTYENNFGASK